MSDVNKNRHIDFTYSLVRWEPSYSDFMLFENADTSLSPNWVPKSNLIAPFQNQYAKTDTAYFDPGFADLDSDGDLDLMVLERIFVAPDSGKASYRFFENQLTADSIAWEERPDWVSGLGNEIYYQSNFGDLDSDGDQDLVFGTQQGTLILYQNIGGEARPYWRKVENAFNLVEINKFVTPTFGDFNNDGRVDLVVGNFHGKLFFYQNETVVSVSDKSEKSPGSFHLFQNYPNPFNPETTIEYELAQPGNVQLTIYNLLGQRVRTLVNEWQPAGSHRVSWDGSRERGASRVASGVYIYELQLGELMTRRKMDLLH
ncbi:MAG: FG-GAP-like repeat-containing protein [bacterium]